MTTAVIIKGVFLVVASTGLVYLSRSSLRSPQSHGFYRFFAWESILVLFIINVDFWFRDPFSFVHILSWILLVLSGYLVFAGVTLLRRYGRQDESRADVPLVSFEKTTRLVTSGIYGRIRHPLYSSLLFLAWGTFLKNPGWLPGVLAGLATVFLVATAKADEKECLRFFGEPYQAYIQNTKMFIPFVF